MTPARHAHVFLATTHARAERNTWATIALATVMMLFEIVGGAMFGSIALVADGFHMSTHAGALLLAALAYTLARRLADDPRFTFGTGKFGDLAGFSSALVLALIALGIGYESAARLFAPKPIDYSAAIPIAALGLAVNLASAWLLSRGGHHHHGHEHHAHPHGDEPRRLEIGGGIRELSVFEQGGPPRFRLGGRKPLAATTHIETIRADGARHRFAMRDRGDFLESEEEIPEPHEFDVRVTIGADVANCHFVEHGQVDAALDRDHNMRAAILHVVADAAVSALVILGLTLAWAFGWAWMDPAAGLVGAAVIASWSYGLIRDTSRVLLDMNPNPGLARSLREAIERDGDVAADLHLWRLGPGHLGAILCVETETDRTCDHYREVARRIGRFSHLTIEIDRLPPRADGARRNVA